MILQRVHAPSELVFVDLALGKSHLQDVSCRAVWGSSAASYVCIAVMVHLGVIEVTDDEVRDRADDDEKQNHDDEPRYSEAQVWTSVKDAAPEGTWATWTEGSDVN